MVIHMNWNYSEGRIYSSDASGNLIAEATYVQRNSGEINVDHVYVNPEYRGQGIAEQVMLEVIEYLRKHHLKATATCSYASAWLSKHEKEYADLLATKQEDQVIACKIDGKH